MRPQHSESERRNTQATPPVTLEYQQWWGWKEWEDIDISDHILDTGEDPSSPPPPTITAWTLRNSSTQ